MAVHNMKFLRQPLFFGVLVFFFISLPALALDPANLPSNKDFKYLVSTIVGGVLNPLVYLISSAALVYFLWGVTKYISKHSEDSEREKGKNIMIYGIIALFVMVSVWGLVNVLTDTLNLDNKTVPTPPTWP